MFIRILIIILLGTQACHDKTNTIMEENTKLSTNAQNITDSVVFGTGCFWCTEALFSQLKGVIKVSSGYMGGHTSNPTYIDVCTGKTGHAEVLKIWYDQSIISFSTLLKAFMISHDPTQLNRQGNDIGTQYRSVIFYQNEEQKNDVLKFINELNSEQVFTSKIVTQIVAASEFYPAEKYHQNYYQLNPDEPYCKYVINPKLKKFKDALKEYINH